MGVPCPNLNCGYSTLMNTVMNLLIIVILFYFLHENFPSLDFLFWMFNEHVSWPSCHWCYLSLCREDDSQLTRSALSSLVTMVIMVTRRLLAPEVRVMATVVIRIHHGDSRAELGSSGSLSLTCHSGCSSPLTAAIANTAALQGWVGASCRRKCHQFNKSPVHQLTPTNSWRKFLSPHRIFLGGKTHPWMLIFNHLHFSFTFSSPHWPCTWYWIVLSAAAVNKQLSPAAVNCTAVSCRLQTAPTAVQSKYGRGAATRDTGEEITRMLGRWGTTDGMCNVENTSSILYYTLFMI